MKFAALAGLIALGLIAGGAWAGRDAPVIKKLGAIDCDMVETTPIVFHEKLYRFEYVRDNYKPNTTGKSYFRFMDVATGEPTPSFAAGYHLGAAFADRDTMYVYGVNTWKASKIQVFWSTDLMVWKDRTAIDLPGWGIFNSSVCKGKDGYVMAFEIDSPPEEAGSPFTMRFATSKDLLDWQLTPKDCVYTKERYSACPALRFLDGYYYMIYLESYPGYYAPNIVRSKDLIHWEESPFKPIMKHSDEDRKIANPKLTHEQRDRIAKAVNLNNSDLDFCEFQGKTIIMYSWGNQTGIEHLAEAVYEGTEADFLRGFFPK
jgi:alpha-L-fucosidase